MLNDAIGDAGHFRSDRGERLTLPVGIKRVGAQVAAILSAELVLTQMNGT